MGQTAKGNPTHHLAELVIPVRQGECREGFSLSAGGFRGCPPESLMLPHLPYIPSPRSAIITP